MDGMTVRKKLAIAYVAAALVFVAAVKLVSLAGAPRILVLVAAVAVGVALFAYATALKCPHCHGKAFSRRWLALCYLPRTCATCDREFFD
jgi:fatty acid desaturase